MDKQIIIDGVDVSGCVCFATAQAIATNTGVILKDIDNACTPKQQPCQDIKNCMFKKLTKQLKAKEQECERLKEEAIKRSKELIRIRKERQEGQEMNRNLHKQLD